MASQQKSYSVLVAGVVTIVIPVLILTRLSGEQYLGPVYSLVLALAFPLLYGLYDFRERHNVNFYSVLGVISVVLTGSIGLLELPARWLALKEAAVPGVIALVILGSHYTRWPIITTFLKQMVAIEKIEAALSDEAAKALWQGRLRVTTYLVAASFLLSAALNFTLARVIVVSQPGTEAFNVELGQLTALSYPVIVLPSLVILMVALLYLLAGIKRLTGLTLEELVNR